MLQKSREDVKEMNNEDAFYCSTVPLLLCLQWQKGNDQQLFKSTPMTMSYSTPSSTCKTISDAHS